MSDRQYARYRYWLEFDKLPDIENPETFSEKIQHIKLYQRNELRRQVADRTKARTYVSNKIGKEHLVPLIGIFKELSREHWEALPDRFVLKANHGCGMLEIVRDKSSTDYEKIYNETENWKEIDYSKVGREWVYKDLPRTILAEELLLNSDGEIPEDFKFFCFHGKVKIIQIDFDRFGDQKRNLYDRSFNRIDATLLYPNYNIPVDKPNNLDRAIEIAEVLSADFNFIRVDLYLMDNKIYFGELTNYPGNGFVDFLPESVARQAGSYLDLDRRDRSD